MMVRGTLIFFVTALIVLATAQVSSRLNAQVAPAPRHVPAYEARQQAAMLASLVVQGRAQVQSFETRMTPLKDELQKLNRQLASLSIGPTKKALKREEAAPEKVGFQPPLAKYVPKSTEIVVVCLKKQVVTIKLSAITDALTGDEQYQAGTAQGTVMIDHPAIEKILYELRERDESAQDFPYKLAFRKDFRGEPPNAGDRPESVYGKALQEESPIDSIVVFFVYPDSYDAFRQARDSAWKQGYGYFWMPMESGQPVGFSFGGGAIGL